MFAHPLVVHFTMDRSTTGCTSLLAVLNILIQPQDCQLGPVFFPTGLFLLAVFLRSGPVQLAVIWQSIGPDLKGLPLMVPLALLPIRSGFYLL